MKNTICRFCLKFLQLQGRAKDFLIDVLKPILKCTNLFQNALKKIISTPFIWYFPSQINWGCCLIILIYVFRIYYILLKRFNNDSNTDSWIYPEFLLMPPYYFHIWCAGVRGHNTGQLQVIDFILCHEDIDRTFNNIGMLCNTTT